MPLPLIEFRLLLLGIPKSTRQLPSLSEEAKHNIVKSLKPSLKGRKPSERRLRMLFTSINGAYVAYRRLHRSVKNTSRKSEGFLEWGSKQDRSLAKILRAATTLVESLDECDQYARLRFSHTADSDINHVQLLEMARMILGVADETYRMRPAFSRNRHPDYAFNALVANLCRGWSTATGLRLSRSTRTDRAPIDFIATVCRELKLEPNEKRIKSAIRWLLRQQANASKQTVDTNTTDNRS